jgi:hypothetical protein
MGRAAQTDRTADHAHRGPLRSGTTSRGRIRDRDRSGSRIFFRSSRPRCRTRCRRDRTHYRSIRQGAERRPDFAATAFTVAHRALIISLALHYRLPNIFALRYNVAEGALASYGVDNIDLYRRAAEYVDRILRGEKPGDLPIQFATKFELVINLKTAKALGLDVPIPVLARTDEVIE